LQVKRRFRLTRSNDYKRVRHQGKSYAHPLVVLITLPNDQPQVRVGVSASHAVGNAVDRNRAKRRLKACLQEELPQLKPGRDVVFLARKSVLDVEFSKLRLVVHQLLSKAGLLDFPVDHV
jgi:ribonuclease P protein component